MDFNLSTRRDDLPYDVDKTYLATSGTVEEFATFVSQFADKERKELVFFHEGNNAYACIEEDRVMYILEPLADNAKIEEEQNAKTENNINKSNVFKSVLVILALMLSIIFTPLAQVSAAVGLEEDPTEYIGLSNARFNTPTGAEAIPGYLAIMNGEDFRTTAYTLEDPNRSFSGTSSNYLPEGSNSELVAAIVSYGIKFDPSTVKSQTGLTVNQRQIKEAVQLSLWTYASSFQINYQIDPNSIADSTVRTLATEITTWATKNVSSSNGSVLSSIFPQFNSTLDASKSTINKSNGSVDYGPYLIEGQVGATFTPDLTSGVLLDSSKVEVKSIKVGQAFYIRYPEAYSGDKIVNLNGFQSEYTLRYAQGRVYLERNLIESNVSFSLGGHSANSGVIQVTAVDAITKEPIQGLQVSLNTTSNVGTLITEQDGVDRFTGSVGTYTLTFIAPAGYLNPEPKEVTLEFAGDIKTIDIQLKWTKGIVNFKGVDSETLAPTGESEALIYDNAGKAVKRIALKDGKANGISIPAGEYTLVQYKSSNNYSINTGTKFTVAQGDIKDISVLQDAKTDITTLTVEQASLSSQWVYTISKGDTVLFKLNGSNEMKLPLPVGEYTAKAIKSDGTAETALTTFRVELNTPTKVGLSQSIGKETVTFSITDTVKKEPIPYLVVGLFDEEHNLVQTKTAGINGKVVFENIKEFDIYYVNILAAPPSVSGYFANGNRFLGDTREFKLELYSLKEIQEVTMLDTIYRIPNVTYSGGEYKYPE